MGQNSFPYDHFLMSMGFCMNPLVQAYLNKMAELNAKIDTFSMLLGLFILR